MAETDEALAGRLGAEPEAALPPLVERYWGRAFGLAYQITRDPDAAEDAAQEAFVRLLRAGGRYEAGRTFRPWFLQIVANCARDAHKVAGRRRRHEERAAVPDLVDPPAGDPEALELLERGLARLRPEQRAALTLHYLEGLTFREVAEVLGCPEGTAASRIRRGLQALRRELAAEEVGVGAAAPLAVLLPGLLGVEAPARPEPAALRRAAVAAAGATTAAAAGLGVKKGLAVLGTALLLGLGGAAFLVRSPDRGPVAGGDLAGASPAPAAADGDPALASADPAPTEVSAPVAPRAADAAAEAAPAAGPPAGAERLAVSVTRGGAPLAGAPVRLARVTPGGASVGDSEARVGPGRVAQTDERGVVRWDLEPGAWAVSLDPLADAGAANDATPVIVAGYEQDGARPGVLLEVGDAGYVGGSAVEWLVRVAADARSIRLDVPPLERVSGRVVAADTGGPLAGAELSCAGFGGAADAAGRFELLVPAGWDFSASGIAAKAPGYAWGWWWPSTRPARDGRLALEPGVDLRCRVLTAEGEPAAGWHVQLSNPSGLQWPLTTDAEGRFVYRDLPPNRGPGGSLVYLTVSDPALGQRLYVDVLARDDHEHVIRMPRWAAVAGRVFASGRPVEGAVVQLFAARPAPAPGGEDEALELTGGITGGEGRFELAGVAPDVPLHLVVSHEDFGRWAGEVTVERDPALTVELERAAPTSVRLTYADGTPAAGVALRVVPKAALGGLDRSTPAPPLLASVERARTGADGEALLERLISGATYGLVVDSDLSGWAAVPLTGGRPLDVALPGAAPPGPARLRVGTPDGASAWGRRVRVFRVGDGARPVFEGEQPSDLEDEGDDWLVVPGVGEVWIEVTRYGEGRALRRAILTPGAEVDLGPVALDPPRVCDVEVRFDADAVGVQRLELRWREPATGILLSDALEQTVGPGEVRPVFLSGTGRVTLEPRWREARDAPWRDLEPREVDLDALPEEPLVIRVP